MAFRRMTGWMFSRWSRLYEGNDAFSHLEEVLREFEASTKYEKSEQAFVFLDNHCDDDCYFADSDGRSDDISRLFGNAADAVALRVSLYKEFPFSLDPDFRRRQDDRIYATTLRVAAGSLLIFFFQVPDCVSNWLSALNRIKFSPLFLSYCEKWQLSAEEHFASLGSVVENVFIPTLKSFYDKFLCINVSMAAVAGNFQSLITIWQRKSKR
eukprot:m.289958 g.289958  ORF g.289958 m.289958 type:complete len:211 (+) comp40716_c0_seq36:2961-3593(+)